jgi:hypothetical protein
MMDKLLKAVVVDGTGTDLKEKALRYVQGYAGHRIGAQHRRRIEREIIREVFGECNRDVLLMLKSKFYTVDVEASAVAAQVEKMLRYY